MNNNKQPLVTVITVAYNSSKYIREAIESVLAQSYKNIEYIIADDCSTDDTWKIINEYKDSRIVAFRNEINLREYPNRNKAVSLATGQYIVFVDGDDYTLENGIEYAINEMLQYSFCGFGVMKIGYSQLLESIAVSSFDGYNSEFFGKRFLESSLTNNIFKSSLLKQNLFLTNYKCSDTYTRLIHLKITDVLILKKPISVWRLTSTQASKKILKLDRFFETAQFIKNYIFDDIDFIFFEKKKLKNQYYRLLLRICFECIKKRKFSKLQALKFLKTDSYYQIFRYII